MAGALAHNRPRQTATLDDVRIMFRNFSGRAGQYNAAGDRNFVAFLPPEVAQAMERDGWSIKQLKSRDEDEAPQDYIKVKVNFQGPRPPKVYMINSRGRHQLTEDMVDMLDWVDIEKTDLIISPYDWEINGRQGRTAYLQTIFVFIREDELEQRYAHIQDAGLEGAQDVLVWHENNPESIETIKIKELEG